jgi:hypothetical protein
VIVKFTRQFNSYHHGERASFDEADAQSLISRGFAVADEEVKEMKQEGTMQPAKTQEPAPKPAQPPTRDFSKDSKVVKK